MEEGIRGDGEVDEDKGGDIRLRSRRASAAKITVGLSESGGGKEANAEREDAARHIPRCEFSARIGASTARNSALKAEEPHERGNGIVRFT